MRCICASESVSYEKTVSLFLVKKHREKAELCVTYNPCSVNILAMFCEVRPWFGLVCFFLQIGNR